ncbi:hypothetical protein Tco_1026577 [Tanacetum coccineum]
MTTSTPSTTPPTTEVQATIVNATDPSLTVLLRLFELKRKVEALSEVNHSEVIKESVQANVLNEVKNQIPNFLPKVVSEFVESRLERTVRDKSHSYLDHDKYHDLYNALLNSIHLDEAIAIGDLDQNKVLKRKRDDDEDQDPPLDSANEKKKKIRKDVKPSKKSSTSKESSKGETPPKASKTDNKDPNADVGPEQACFNDLEKATKYPAKFDDLMGSTIDFSNFIKHRLKKDKITKVNLEGPVFKLLKGTCRSGIELEYHLGQRYLAPSLIRWIRQILKVNKQFGYGHLEEILVRRVDKKEYMFKEVTVLRMFTRSLLIKKRVEDVQLGVESYQKELNITKPQKEFAGISFKELYTTTYDPKGVVYINKSKQKRLISNTLSWKSYQGDSSKLNLPDYMSVLTELEVYSKAMYDDLKMFKITVYQACWNKLKIKAHYILKQDKVQRIKATSKTEDIHRMLNSFTEYELKNMLYDKMQQSRSFQEHYKHLDLYNALISSIGLDEAIAKGDIYPAKVLKKRRRDDKDEDPPAKSDKEKKMRKLKDYEPPKDDQAGSSKKVEEPVQEVAMDVEEPVDDEVVNVEEHPQDDASPKQDKSTWFKQPPRPETPNP